MNSYSMSSKIQNYLSKTTSLICNYKYNMEFLIKAIIGGLVIAGVVTAADKSKVRMIRMLL